MVPNTAQSTAAVPFPKTKRNVAYKPSPSVLRNANGRRPRSRTNNMPSPVVIAREAARDPARRGSLSPAPVAPGRTRRVPMKHSRVEMASLASAIDASAASPRIALPKRLQRPAFCDIAPAAIEAVDPDLKGVTLEYIHHKLRNVGQRMFSVAASTVADPPRNRLPHELEVVINDISADVPTHLFAVYSRPAFRVVVHPAHALVLAVHCTHLPSLPHSKPATPTSAGGTLTLPVVPLCLPSPATFPILMHYLYTKRADCLLASLLPMPPHDASQSLDQLSRSVAAAFPVPVLLSHAAKVHDLWRNVTALGVFDERLWRTIEMAWEVILGALATSAGASWRSQHPQL